MLCTIMPHTTVTVSISLLMPAHLLIKLNGTFGLYNTLNN